MFIAQQLRDKNIAEYLIYMWQIEDLIRANGFDIERIKATVVSGFQIAEKERFQLVSWYEDLIRMMRDEGVVEKGHLQINENIIILLSELHSMLLRSSEYPFYGSAYFKVLPYIAELRAKSRKTDEAELKTCFEALYGLMLLRLQKKEVSAGTVKAVAEISKLISMLADFYNKQRNGDLKIDN